MVHHMFRPVFCRPRYPVSKPILFKSLSPAAVRKLYHLWQEHYVDYKADASPQLQVGL